MWSNAPVLDAGQSDRAFKIINAEMRAVKPLVGIPADRRLLNQHWFHAVGEKYIAAVAEAAGAVPVLIPALGEALDLEQLLQDFDGLLLTGSPSNVEPHHYKGPNSDPGTLHDPHRDATTLPLIPAAVAAGLPTLGLCRGFQEMNVAFGGTLWQKLHEAGFSDHRENSNDPLDVQYGPAHDVVLEPGGVLRALAGAERIRVNSLHSQGVQTLAPPLVVEARAPDGVIEAFRVKDADFALAVQWHPEWKFAANPFSQRLFRAFGDAARRRAAQRRGADPAPIDVRKVERHVG
jgi:putative glutamine amidotransferase